VVGRVRQVNRPKRRVASGWHFLAGLHDLLRWSATPGRTRKDVVRPHGSRKHFAVLDSPSGTPSRDRCRSSPGDLLVAPPRWLMIVSLKPSLVGPLDRVGAVAVVADRQFLAGRDGGRVDLLSYCRRDACVARSRRFEGTLRGLTLERAFSGGANCVSPVWQFVQVAVTVRPLFSRPFPWMSRCSAPRPATHSPSAVPPRSGRRDDTGAEVRHLCRERRRPRCRACFGSVPAVHSRHVGPCRHSSPGALAVGAQLVLLGDLGMTGGQSTFAWMVSHGRTFDGVTPMLALAA